MKPTRDEALALLKKYNKTESLIRHALAVEGVMRHFANLTPGSDGETWGIVGLLHDIDYELYPDEHLKRTPEILAEANVDEEIIRACLSHGYGICTDVEPLSDMEKTLFTVDELTGLVTAAALMRPSKSVMDMELSSVKKKYKTKSFAAGVDRDLVERGAQMLGMPLDEVLWQVVLGMRNISGSIGL